MTDKVIMEHDERSCPNTKKIDLLYEKWESTNVRLIEKIEILNNHIPELLKVINEHKVAIATLSHTTTSIVSDFRLLDQRNNEDHKQIHAKIGREIDNVNRCVKDEFYNKIEKLDNRQFEMVKEVNQTIGRKTLTPILISVISLIVMILSVVVMSIK